MMLDKIDNIMISETYGPSHKDDAFLVNDLQEGEGGTSDF